MFGKKIKKSLFYIYLNENFDISAKALSDYAYTNLQ